MAKFILSDIEKCTGCGRCELICSALKEGEFVPVKSRIHFLNFPRNGFSVPSICFQCEKPACAEACPEEAISRSKAGAMVVEEGRCTGCAACVTACPYGVIWVNDEGLAYKCDLCGGDPECVKVCNPKAIVYAEMDEARREERLLQMANKARGEDSATKCKVIARVFLNRYR